MGQDPVDLPALRNTSVRVLPTRSIYEFDGAGVLVTMTFLEPALPQDLDVYSWPLSYIVWNVTIENREPASYPDLLEHQFSTIGE
jgi:hypothetical protein